MWYHLYVGSKKEEPIEIKIRIVITRGSEGKVGWGQWRDVGQRVQLSDGRWIGSGDLMYNMLTIVNYTVLYTWKWLGE